MKGPFRSTSKCSWDVGSVTGPTPPPPPRPAPPGPTASLPTHSVCSPGISLMGSRWADFKRAAFLSFSLPFFPLLLISLFTLQITLFSSLSIQEPRMKSPSNQKLFGRVRTGCDSVTHRFLPGWWVGGAVPGSRPSLGLPESLPPTRGNIESSRLIRILFILFLRLVQGFLKDPYIFL